MTRRAYWGLVILIIGLISVGCALFIQRTDTNQHPAEQILKAPPEGETFATGHWDGDTWHRTVLKNPETITYKGAKLTLSELYSAAFHHKNSWEERVEMLNLLIAEAPYSINAYYARRHLARHDENGKYIYDNVLLFERMKPLLKYYPDSPRLLHDLMMKIWSSHPEETIRYGKEALKYVDMYPMNSGYSQYPESIHHLLGYAYEEIGDYTTALKHLNQALKMYNIHQDRTRDSILSAYTLKRHIIQIHKGNPILGPLSDGSVSGLPERAPESSRVIIGE